jgi:hypothetical protein
MRHAVRVAGIHVFLAADQQTSTGWKSPAGDPSSNTQS